MHYFIKSQFITKDDFSFQDGRVFCTYSATCESDESSDGQHDWAFMTKLEALNKLPMIIHNEAAIIEEFYAF